MSEYRKGYIQGVKDVILYTFGFISYGIILIKAIEIIAK